MKNLVCLVLLFLAAGSLPACAATQPTPESRSEARSVSDQDSIIATYQSALAADPRDVISHFNLGLAYYQAERWTEARDTLEKCLRTNPGDQSAQAFKAVSEQLFVSQPLHAIHFALGAMPTW